MRGRAARGVLPSRGGEGAAGARLAETPRGQKPVGLASAFNSASGGNPVSDGFETGVSYE